MRCFSQFTQTILSYNLAIVRVLDDQILGWIGIGEASDAKPRVLDFGYALLPAYWGQDYATEALNAILRIGFVTLCAAQIFGECVQNNKASARVMEKSGLEAVTLPAVRGSSEIRFAMSRAMWEANYGTNLDAG